MEYFGAWGTLIHEQNLKSKISCQTPFNKGLGWFLNFSEVELNVFFPVNAKITLIAYVIRLIFYLNSRRAFLTKVVSFYKQPIRGSIGFV